MRHLAHIFLACSLRMCGALGWWRRAGAVAYRSRARRLARDGRGRIRRWGVRFELNLNDNVQRTFYYTGWYERRFLEFLRRELGPDDTYVDVGAHVGIDAAFVARLVPCGKVIAFEPSPDLVAGLNDSVGRLPNVHVVPAALGDEPGEVDLRANPKWHPDDASVRSRFGAGSPVYSVRMLRFDDWSTGVERMDVVKLDIEGGELDALRGMSESLQRLRPRVLAVEMHGPHLAAAGTTEGEIVDFLAEFGYERENTIGENAIFRLRGAESAVAAQVETRERRHARGRLRVLVPAAVDSPFTAGNSLRRWLLPTPGTHHEGARTRVRSLGWRMAEFARSRKLRSPWFVGIGLPLAGIAGFATTAMLAEAFTDRDWRLSGFEWPTDFLTAALLVCLVPVILSAVQPLFGVRRRRARAAKARASRTR